MLKKEIKAMVQNPAYVILPFLPFLLTFFMSEGTKNYLGQGLNPVGFFQSAKPVIFYGKAILTAQVQFAVSELSFMLTMVSILAGLNLFEERKVRVWDRVVCKKKMVGIKFLCHYGFSLLMCLISLGLFQVVYEISFPVVGQLLFFSIPIFSISFGLLMGLVVGNRAMLSNIVLLTVMISGYFGGAFSLVSVLSTTRFMNMLRYFSPLALVNELVYHQILGLSSPEKMGLWLGINGLISGACMVLMQRRIRHGAIL